MVFPLIPLGFEFIFTKGISRSSADLVTSTYAITLGVGSRTRLWFGIDMIVGFVFAASFGKSIDDVSTQAATAMNMNLFWPLVTVVVLFVIHAIERYNIHVADRMPFWEFMSEGHRNDIV